MDFTMGKCTPTPTPAPHPRHVVKHPARSWTCPALRSPNAGGGLYCFHSSLSACPTPLCKGDLQPKCGSKVSRHKLPSSHNFVCCVSTNYIQMHSLVHQTVNTQKISKQYNWKPFFFTLPKHRINFLWSNLCDFDEDHSLDDNPWHL